MNDLVGKILSVAEEKNCQNRNHQNSRKGRRRRAFYFSHGTLDIRAMALEKGSDLIRPLVGPTKVTSEVAGNFSGGDSVRQRGDCRQKLARALAKSRKETVGEKHGEGDEDKIGFHDVRASQVFEKERAPLQKSHDRIDQICEQDRKGKNDDDCARDADDGKHQHKEKDGQQYTCSPTIR